MCAGNEPDPGFRIEEAVFNNPGFVAYMQEARRGYIEWDGASLVSTEPNPIGHRLRSLLSRAWASLKDFLDPSQFD